MYGLTLACAAPRPIEHPPSIMIVTIDTLRADRVGAYGDDKARTPVMDGLAKAGVVFERAFTPVPITLPAHVSLMTGLLPPAHGVRGNGSFALGAGPTTLAEVMKKTGRQTAAFIGGFPLSRRFGLSRGFDVYDDSVTKADGVNYDLAERRADSVVERALAWLVANPGPSFVWVHLFDPHAPYDPPEAFRTDDPYRDEIASADASLGRLISAWDARAGKSLVVVTSDHGEAFGEHGEWSHSLFVYDTTLHVPLIVRGSGFDPGRRSQVSVSLVDIAATLAEFTGSSGAIPGVSLTSALKPEAVGRPLYAETMSPRLDFGWSELRSWREDGFKWIRAPRPELFSLAEDRGEETNLASTDPRRGRALDGALGTALTTMGEKSAAQGADPETVERLRSLGYVQGTGGKGSGADPKDKVAVARQIAQAAGPFNGWDEAIVAYRGLVKLDPENPLLNLRLADALLRSGRVEASLPHFAQVIRSGSNTADPFVGQGTALAQLNRLKEARAVLESGLKVAPASGQLHFNLGEIARMEGRQRDAIREFEDAALDPATRERAKARLAALR